MERHLIRIDQEVTFYLNDGNTIFGRIRYIPPAGEAWVIEVDGAYMYFVQSYQYMVAHPIVAQTEDIPF